MYRIGKEFKFEAAHQLESAYSSECVDCVHGHSYRVELILTRERLNADDMVVDFGQLRNFIDEIRSEWDHGLLLHEDKEHRLVGQVGTIWDPNKVHFFSQNPTAEFLAREIHRRLVEFMVEVDSTVGVERVRVHETATGWGEYCG